jgi:hypothetical protein
MKLVARFRRWWNPAQWRDDHPGEDDGRSHTPEGRRLREVGITDECFDPAASFDRVDVERALKRPKH